MKDQPLLYAVLSLGMVLLSVVVMAYLKLDTSVILVIAGGVGVLCGAIAGISQPKGKTENSNNVTTTNTDGDKV